MVALSPIHAYQLTDDLKQKLQREWPDYVQQKLEEFFPLARKHVDGEEAHTQALKDVCETCLHGMYDAFLQHLKNGEALKTNQQLNHNDVMEWSDSSRDRIITAYRLGEAKLLPYFDTRTCERVMGRIVRYALDSFKEVFPKAASLTVPPSLRLGKEWHHR